jgi:ABC-type glycerol-3-phosphate transport system substrate-binding protein
MKMKKAAFFLALAGLALAGCGSSSSTSSTSSIVAFVLVIERISSIVRSRTATGTVTHTVR